MNIPANTKKLVPIEDVLYIAVHNGRVVEKLHVKAPNGAAYAKAAMAHLLDAGCVLYVKVGKQPEDKDGC